jgi:NAD(P)-dependent dehydrogenase (short-subunit alcohol dehydrogenase family)
MSNDTILITGTSSGIGLHTAVHLARRGFRVVASMRDTGRRADLDAAAASANVTLDVIPLDVTDEASVADAVRHIETAYGSLYGLVNNAGINTSGFFEDLSDQEMRGVFEVNLFGTMAVTRAVLPMMRTAKRGRIVIVGSIGGRISSLGASAYCSSKFALEGFGEALAREMAPFGVRVSILEPGAVKTELFGRNRSTALRAAGPESPYREWTSSLERLLARLEEMPATSLESVAVTVERALSARRPRLRYVVGWRPRLLLALRRFLPQELFERLWTRGTWRQIEASRAS